MRIGAEGSTECLEYGAELDSVQHTLEKCPAFEEQRGALTAAIGEDLSPVAVVGALLADENQRRAVSIFHEKVMTKKEVVERSQKKNNQAR
ncbi:hypothetical protein QLX08_010324 [Tetragonisca angustula]|uniref:Uncharacterized protein n=1 Tax=Tetragonisca angustula TaxID=166442 RepID=A0AAW0ZD35_9HYME